MIDEMVHSIPTSRFIPHGGVQRSRSGTLASIETGALISLVSRAYMPSVVTMVRPVHRAPAKRGEKVRAAVTTEFLVTSLMSIACLVAVVVAVAFTFVPAASEPAKTFGSIALIAFGLSAHRAASIAQGG
ncbi:hypothetical protein [Sphingomonas sp. PP-CC-3G-468]|uniref:hypothetical protein n=1 Tax=Sphingomonas sp. PP-CC-3G-468 TaxID=2135656 RepID=UPI0010506130|nr:hypothetical protein [Sphingomonas sp. PP-CC-3G-468]